MSQKLLLCGFELRRGPGGKDLTVYHCQTARGKVMTFLDSRPPSSEGVGEFLFCEDESDIHQNMKAFRPWRMREPGKGRVRGYTVTKTPTGVDAWVYVQVKTQVGPRNIPCLVAEGIVSLTSEEDFRGWWQDLIMIVMGDHPLTETREIYSDPKTGLYRLDGFDGYELSDEPAVDPPLRAELQPSPAR